MRIEVFPFIRVYQRPSVSLKSNGASYFDASIISTNRWNR